MPSDAKMAKKPSTVRITIQADDYQDTGLGVIVAKHPLTVLAPSHLVELVEQGQSQSISINGECFGQAKILPVAALQRDHLSILQFKGRRRPNVSAVRLPKIAPTLREGQPIELQRPESDDNSVGAVLEVADRGDGCSVITDVAVTSGDSGSPLIVGNQLVAVCQGMIQREGSGTAVAVPLTADSLMELRRLRSRYRISMISALIAAFLVVAGAFGGFAVYSANSFSVAAIDVSEDGSFVTATNSERLTLNTSWTRSFDTNIRRSLALASKTDGKLDRVAIGTVCHAGINGQIALLSANGRTLWSYSVPDGECIYSTHSEVYNGFLVDRIYAEDLDQDGNMELLVVFVHDHFYPCKLVVFSMQGSILAEFWHPGYIRTIVSGKVGESNDVISLVSASNNALKTEFWNPQTIFAFRGLDISGQAPPYTGTVGSESSLEPSHELWTWVIVNIDPLTLRAKCTDFNIVDLDGDGLNDIQVPLTDGRFYHLSKAGQPVGIELGDRFLEAFPNTPPPPLVEIWDYIDQTQGTALQRAGSDS